MISRRIMIAGTASGTGKTTLTIALMAAFKKKGYSVQGFKCGPDYIDPTFHTAVSGRPSRNLDSWMLSHDTLKAVFKNGSLGADISIMEGVMGFFDGQSPLSNKGSSAEIAAITKTPVLLVVNCEAMARSAAAVVKGFQAFSGDVNIVGVIANKVGNPGHYELVKAAIEQECKIPVVGYLKNEPDLTLPERHLGLIPAVEQGGLDELFDRLGNAILSSVDIDCIYELAQTSPVDVEMSSLFPSKTNLEVRIAVARDSAFHFYYPENLELLEAYGADVVTFSPLADEKLPDHVDGVYIGGGFPEQYARSLAGNKKFKRSLKQGVENELPVLAECGGLMILADELVTADGKNYPMAAVIPGRIKMQKNLASFGYREVTGTEDNALLAPGDLAKGHEFHFSAFEPEKPLVPAYKVHGSDSEGVLYKNLIAGYTHLHFASNPKMVERWLGFCFECRKNRR
ncbi:MAG TPA: cobyrinate a,c-diamide synthase [Bacillales bacterium]|nr:cobyrinate a,c-diamide synthase [Bacillales bacterium]